MAVDATIDSSLVKTMCDGMRRLPTRLCMPAVAALASALLLLNG